MSKTEEQKLSLGQVVEVLDNLAQHIADKINETITREHPNYLGLHHSGIDNLALFMVTDVNLGRPRISSTGGFLNMYNFRFVIELRNDGGRLEIVFTNSASGVNTFGDDTNVHVTYTCFPEQKFKDINHVSGHQFRYKTWDDFMADLSNLGTKVGKVYETYDKLAEDTQKLIWELGKEFGG
jgi:hypothetical protein